MNAENCFCTVDDVSRYLKVSNDTIYRWIEKKGMPAIRIGKNGFSRKAKLMRGWKPLPKKESNHAEFNAA